MQGFQERRRTKNFQVVRGALKKNNSVFFDHAIENKCQQGQRPEIFESIAVP